MRQGAGTADFDRDIVAGRERQQLWQIGERIIPREAAGCQSGRE
jgi:hypothetical protein